MLEYNIFQYNNKKKNEKKAMSGMIFVVLKRWFMNFVLPSTMFIKLKLNKWQLRVTGHCVWKFYLILVF